MSKKWYGSLNNRFDEGKYYNGTYNNLNEGTDITMYYYSDCTCYYITKVNSQTDICVKDYVVCADHSKEGGMGHQNWLYFKTRKEEQQYINECVKNHLLPKDMYEDDLNSIKESDEERWVYRYNKWMRMKEWNLNSWNNYLESIKSDASNQENVECLGAFYARLNENDLEKIKAGKTVKKYFDLSGRVSFGVRNYYYDWSF